MPKQIPIEKETIIRLYYTENLKLSEVAQELGVCKDTVRRHMRLFSIPPKAPDVYRKGQSNKVIAMLPTVRELYFEKGLSLGEVSQALGISFVTLKRLLADNNLPTRDIREAVKLAYQNHPSMGFKTGDLHPRYNGYRTNEYHGYVRVYNPAHPRTGKNGYVPEQILVWEENHHQPLPDDWIVHHLNGIKNDNRPENLLGLPNKTHCRILPEKEKHIQMLENRVRNLEKALLVATKMLLRLVTPP